MGSLPPAEAQQLQAARSFLASVHAAAPAPALLGACRCATHPLSRGQRRLLAVCRLLAGI